MIWLGLWIVGALATSFLLGVLEEYNSRDDVSVCWASVGWPFTFLFALGALVMMGPRLLGNWLGARWRGRAIAAKDAKAEQERERRAYLSRAEREIKDYLSEVTL